MTKYIIGIVVKGLPLALWIILGVCAGMNMTYWIMLAVVSVADVVSIVIDIRNAIRALQSNRRMYT